MPTTDDPIRGWLAAQREAAEDRAMARALTRAAANLDEHQADEQQAPNLDSLTAGGMPADYEPPSTGDRFRDWMRSSIHR